MADDIRDLTSAVSELSSRLARLEGRLGPNSPIADPAPWPWPQPSPFPFPRWPHWPGPFPGPIPDPAPIDFGRLTQVQLEATMHELSAQKVRVDAALSDLQKQLGSKRSK